MALPGIVYAIMLGVALGTAAYFLFTDDERQQYRYSTKSEQHSRDIPLPKRTENERENTEGQSQTDKRKRKKCSTKSVCTICQEEVNFLCDYTKLMCDHIFHQKCITTWLIRNKTCPNCRVKQPNW